MSVEGGCQEAPIFPHFSELRFVISKMGVLSCRGPAVCSMSSVLHVQMLQDDGAGEDLKQRFGVFNDPVDTSMAATAREPGEPEATDGTSWLA